MDGVLFVITLGLIFVLIIESYNYRQFIKSAKNVGVLGDAIQAAFGAVSVDMTHFNEVMLAFDQRMNDVERGIDIADQNAAIAEIMIDMLAAAMQIDEAKFKRIGRLQSLKPEK